MSTRPYPVGGELIRILSNRYIDGFVVGLLCVAVLGLLLPTSGHLADILSWAIKIGIGLLFFLYGARLSTREVLAGMRHWRLHLTILTLSFVCFPALGVTVGMMFGNLLPDDVVAGLVFVTLISATTQSCISNTTIARGNVPAAIVATSTSSVLGVFITPLLAASTLATTGAAHIDPSAVVPIVGQLLVPFLAGQLINPRIGGALGRRSRALMRVDRSLILFVVFAAFSKGSGAGIWGSVSLPQFVLLLTLCAVLLVAATTFASVAGKVLRLSRDDRTVVTFVGTSKSVAVGLPMATVLFSGNQTALIILPLMCFFQLQTISCSFIAQRWAWRARDEAADEPAASAPSAAYQELLRRLQLHSGGDGTIASIFGGSDELARAAPEAAEVALRSGGHDEPRTPRDRAMRVGMFASGNVGFLVVDADARPALERFATSARSIEDELQLFQELQSAGALDRSPDSEEALAAVLTSAGDNPIRLVGFDTRIGRTTGRLDQTEYVGRRLQTADPDMADAVSRILAQLPPGRKVAVLTGAPHTNSVGGADNSFTGIHLHPGDAICYSQHAYSADAVVADDLTSVHDPPRQRQPAELVDSPCGPSSFTRDRVLCRTCRHETVARASQLSDEEALQSARLSTHCRMRPPTESRASP